MNKVLPIGGPGPALSSLDQANLLFDITGQPPKYFPVPVALMDGIIGIFDFLARLFPGLAVSAGQHGWGLCQKGLGVALITRRAPKVQHFHPGQLSEQKLCF